MLRSCFRRRGLAVPQQLSELVTGVQVPRGEVHPRFRGLTHLIVHPVHAEGGPQPRAADVGAAILAKGGTAFDAAVATAFSQMVNDPFMCGMGGMGTLQVFRSQKQVEGAAKDIEVLKADGVPFEVLDAADALLADLLKQGEADHLAKPSEFKRYGSARKLYTFNIDNASSY